MTISRVGVATGTTTCTVPAHAIGDLIVIFAFRGGSTTAPTLPAGYTSILTKSGTSCSGRLGRKIATSTSDASGTWTNSSELVCHVYRSSGFGSGGSVFIGGSASSSSTNNTVNYPLLTMTHGDGTSWVMGVAGVNNTTETVNTAPSGMTNQSAVTGASQRAAGHDTAGAVSSWASTNATTTGTAGNSVSATLEIIENQGGSAIGQLVQYVSFGSNENFENGNTFKYPLPNPTLANNLLVACLSYAESAGRTIAITDGVNTWSGTPNVTTNDTSNLLTSSIFLVAGAAAGATQLQVVFDTAIQGVKLDFFEFSGMATSSVTDGSAGANLVLTTGAIASGSITTVSDGDLILQFGSNSSFGPNLSGDAITSLLSGSEFTRLVMDKRTGVVIQAKIQTTHGAINPSFTCQDGGGGSYNSLTIALKTSAGAGTRPAAGMTVIGIKHERQQAAGTADYIAYLPSQGNLLVAFTAYDDTQETMNSISDTTDGLWTLNNTTGFPQFLYMPNATVPALGRQLDINTTDHSASNFHLLIYDVTGAAAAPFDVAARTSGGSFGPGTISNAPSITPSTANGLILSSLNLFTGPPDSMSSPTGVVFDSIFYTGYTDLSPADSGDGYAHFYNPAATSYSFAWHDTAATTGWNATAAAFKAAAIASGPLYDPWPQLMPLLAQ